MEETDMLFAPIFDTSIAAIFLYSLIYGLIALIFVVLVETFTLWLLHWDSFLRSLRDSTIANIVTIFFGLSLYTTYAPQWLDIFDETRFTSNMFILWALSVIIESVVLYIICKKSYKRAMIISTIINIWSYIPLSLWLSTYVL